jgi:phage gpG-like protein
LIVAGNRVQLEIIDQDVREKLKALQDSAADMSPALNVVGRTVRDRILLGFKFSRSPYGQQWAPLKIREGVPLIDSGRLRSSISYQVGGTSGGQYVDVGTNYGPLNGGGSVAAVHQFGAVIKPKQAKFLRFMGANGYIFAKKVVVPARPFMPIQGNDLVMPDSWSTAITKALKRHFDSTLSAEQ